MTTAACDKGHDRENLTDPRLVAVRGARHPALLLAVLFAIGVVIADASDYGPWTWVVSALIAALGVAVSLRSPRSSLALMLAAAFLVTSLGGVRMAVELSGRPEPKLTELINSADVVEVVGRLDEIPREKLSGWSVPLELLSVKSQGRVLPLHSHAILTAHNSMAQYRHGDCIRLTGRFEAPFVRRNPGGFDYANHLFRQGIDAVLRPTGAIARLETTKAPWSVANLVEPSRGWIRRVFSTYLPRSARSLILGFLLGDTDQLTPAVIAAFRDSGTLHLLAVSGANVWLIVGLLVWPMRLLKVPRWPRTIILVAVVIAFSFLTRNEPSVVRASLMVVLILIGRLVYRPVSLLHTIGVSAVVILLISPSQLFRPGFQLSYAAVIGIAMTAQRTQHWAYGLRPAWMRVVALAVISSVAATVVTAPIVAWHFGTVSIAALAANLAMIPLAAMGLYACVGVAALSVLSAAAAGWLAYPAERILGLSSYVAQLFARFPGGHWPWPDPSLFWIIHLYLAGLLILNWRHRYRWVHPTIWYAVVLLFLSFAQDLLRPHAPTITLAYLDTGNTRVAANAHPDGDLLWLADDPGIDDQLQQWVMVPFARAALESVKSQRVLPWRRTDSVSLARPLITSASSTCSAPVWRRYLSTKDTTSSPSRIWADRFSWGSDTILCVRDYPTSPPGGAWLDTLLGAGQTLILPAQIPDRLLRQLLERLVPKAVIVFGAVPRWRHAGQRLERWRMRFPHVDFYSTAVDGGVVVRFGPDSVTISPTITETNRPNPPQG